MNLKEIALRDNYCSDDSNIMEELFRPSLRCSRIYFRSVGYLDSKVMAWLAEEFESFANSGGECSLLIGRTVSSADYVAIREGKLNPERFTNIPDLDELWDGIQHDKTKARGLLVLSWLVAKRIVKVRFSLRPKGIHHDKFAFFRDEVGNEVICHGTNNETEAASLPEFNYESLSVFKSWEKESYLKHGEYKLAEFLKLWAGKSKFSISVEAPHPELEKLAFLSESEKLNPDYSDIFRNLEKTAGELGSLPRIPFFFGDARYELQEHQKNAINEFYEADYHGIFPMATGSGKTITAIHAITNLANELAQNNSCDILVIVSVPYQILADQWIDNLEVFGYRPIGAYVSKANWLTRFNLVADMSILNPAARVHSVVVVNRTLQSDEFQNLLNRFSPDRVIYIGDECHRLGSVIEKRKMPNADYRLGLSATPWARHEQELENQLRKYFGKPIAYFGLKDAFSKKVLVPYNYYPLFIKLTSEEGENYEAVTSEIKKLQAIKLSGGDIDESTLNYHLSVRAAIIGSASEKFTSLKAVLEEIDEKMGLSHLLVYCGSGSTEDESLTTGSARDIEKAQQIALQTMDLNSGRITASEHRELRRMILNSFENGSLDAVFAIKVLDEGFDMPGIRGALILASSRNERQFIQRRGRVLRKAQNKEIAYIWDYIVSGEGVMLNQYADELALGEFRRAGEFARLSANCSETQQELTNYANRHTIDIQSVMDELEQNPYEDLYDE